MYGVHCRNTSRPKEVISEEKLVSEFKKILNSGFTSSLETSGWCVEDIATGLMAHGVAIISNAKSIENMDDTQALIKIERLIQERYPKFKLSKRKSI